MAATITNPSPGGIGVPTLLPTAHNDPFFSPNTTTTTNASAPHRYGPLDADHLSTFSTTSPAHAKRALEAHLLATDRRIQDASRLGSTLLQQRKDISLRLKDVEHAQQQQQDNPGEDGPTLPPELRKKLAELENEYNQVGRESARAFLPKPRAPLESVDGNGNPAAVLTGQARESPTKVSAPPPSSRRLRNQSSNRVHDIEFAAEISTSLLAQVRQLQAVLAEKDEALHKTGAANAQLEADVSNLALRVRQLDANETRYKDETWNLETKLQDLETAHRDAVDRHERALQGLKSAEADKSATVRELDGLKVAHEKVGDEHALLQRQQESDLHALRRDLVAHQSEKQTLGQRVQELTAQNTELSAALASRWQLAHQSSSQHDDDADARALGAGEDGEDGLPDFSEPPSPVKATPRHGLESETLKSSLAHAHRMMQGLRGNLHREKTEKVELRRLLQEARDEIESSRRGEVVAAGAAARKRRGEADGKGGKRGVRALGMGRGGTTTSTEIYEEADDAEPDWEDHDGLQTTPSKSSHAATSTAAVGAVTGAAAVGGVYVLDRAAAGHQDKAETTDTDAFQTAHERDTETEAFETGAENFSSDGERTETESLAPPVPTVTRSGTTRIVSGAGSAALGLVGAKAGDRRSYQSTASTSADEADDTAATTAVRTPVQASSVLLGTHAQQQQQPKYRLRMSKRGSKQRLVGGSGRVGDLIAADSPGSLMQGTESPRSTSSVGTPVRVSGAGQSLGDELEGLEDDEGSMGGTPASRAAAFEEQAGAGFVATPRNATSGLDGSAGLGGETDHAEGDKIGEKEREPETSGPIFMSSPLPQQDSTAMRPTDDRALLAQQSQPGMMAHESVGKRVLMVDKGCMTDAIPYPTTSQTLPQQIPSDIVGAGEQSLPHQPHTMRDRAGEVIGGALAGFGLGRFAGHVGKHAAEQDEREAVPGAQEDIGSGIAADAASAATAIEKEKKIAMPDDKAIDVGAPAPPQHPSAMAVEPRAAAAMGVDEPKSLRKDVGEPLLPAGQLETEPSAGSTADVQHPVLISRETAPLLPYSGERSTDAASNVRCRTAGDTGSAGLPNGATSVLGGAASVAAIAHAASPAATKQRHPVLAFSTIETQDFAPHLVSPSTPRLPRRSSRRLDGLLADDDADDAEAGGPGSGSLHPGSGFFAAGIAPLLVRTRSRSMPASASALRSRNFATNEDGPGRDVIEPKVYGGILQKEGGIPTLQFGDDGEENDGVAKPFALPGVEARLAGAGLQRPLVTQQQDEEVPVPEPLQVNRSMVDGGAQTMISGDEIEGMLRNKNAASTAVVAPSSTDAAMSPVKPQRRSVDGMVVGGRRSVDGTTVNEAQALRAPRRPTSATNIRNSKGAKVPPPLPEDHTLKIAAATVGTAGSMGPPIMPASAYKQTRPRTPAGSREGGTMSRPRARDSRQPIGSPAGPSRRTSVSSFASELDERFNITRGNLMYPGDIEPSTDPRMIQAITQTMIGEYLWKYTRKAGRSETSSTRHRRFFWIHPYTRTLYWSEKDPSTAGKDMLKAKSVAINAVRIISDDNAYPPGLHRKSIVVMTPGREIVFTAPTGQRHETWFNALSYLLLRTEQEKEEAADTFDQDDADEFNPGFSIRRSLSRMTGRDRSQSRQSRHSHVSLSSYNSRTTRTSSPRRQSTTIRGAPAAAAPALTPTLVSHAAAAGTATSRTSTMRDGSVSGRLSSLTSKFRPSTGSLRGAPGSLSTRRGRHGAGSESTEIYDANVVGESAEDLRAVIERQEREADRVENVRACCDGKHDVGSLSRNSGRHSSVNGRHGSFTSRSMGSRHDYGSHHHAHPAAPPRAEPIQESQRPRRGE